MFASNVPPWTPVLVSSQLELLESVITTLRFGEGRDAGSDAHCPQRFF